MSRLIATWAFPLLLGIALLALTSCRTIPRYGATTDELPDLTPTHLDYVDSDGFDALFESALVNQDPVIIVRTGKSKPDWEGRLNAWIAAWNRGDRSSRRPHHRGAMDEAQPVVRGQVGVPSVTVDGESIREFRLLVGGLLDRIDDAAQNGGAWWVEERARSRRVALLKPYSLRFHKDEEDLIQLVFFHGGYESYYPRHLQLLMRINDKMEAKWSRSMECSFCPKKRLRENVDQLISRKSAS